MTADQERAAIVRAQKVRDILELWFFRDLNDAQRMKLLGLLGWPDPAPKSMHEQRLLLRHAVSELAPDHHKDQGHV